LVIVLCLVGGAVPVTPPLDLPPGFSASLYASGIDGARDLHVRGDGTITLRGADDRFEILPATADQPVTVMRVAAELAAPRSTTPATLAVQAPRFVRMRWNSTSGELAYALASADGTSIPVSPHVLALAHALDHRPDADVVIAPDGSLFVADSRAGAVWRIRRSAL
jgi:hypothetical protein